MKRGSTHPTQSVHPALLTQGMAAGFFGFVVQFFVSLLVRALVLPQAAAAPMRVSFVSLLLPSAVGAAAAGVAIGLLAPIRPRRMAMGVALMSWIELGPAIDSRDLAVLHASIAYLVPLAVAAIFSSLVAPWSRAAANETRTSDDFRF